MQINEKPNKGFLTIGAKARLSQNPDVGFKNMKCLIILVTFFLTTMVSRADFFTALADYPIGTNASGRIELTATNTPSGNPAYIAHIFTDSGPREYPVILPPATDPLPFIGKRCFIDAVIEANDTTEWKRQFRITKIELIKENETQQSVPECLLRGK